MDLPEATGLPLVAEPPLVATVHPAAVHLPAVTVRPAAVRLPAASVRLAAVRLLPADSVRPVVVRPPVDSVRPVVRPVATVSRRRTRTAVLRPACRVVASVVRLR